MDQDVEDEFASLAIEGHDDDAVGLGEEESESAEGMVDLCLVGRFITNKPSNFTAMKSRLVNYGSRLRVSIIKF